MHQNAALSQIRFGIFGICTTTKSKSPVMADQNAEIAKTGFNFYASCCDLVIIFALIASSIYLARALSRTSVVHVVHKALEDDSTSALLNAIVWQPLYYLQTLEYLARVWVIGGGFLLQLVLPVLSVVDRLRPFDYSTDTCLSTDDSSVTQSNLSRLVQIVALSSQYLFSSTQASWALQLIIIKLGLLALLAAHTYKQRSTTTLRIIRELVSTLLAPSSLDISLEQVFLHVFEVGLPYYRWHLQSSITSQQLSELLQAHLSRNAIDINPKLQSKFVLTTIEILRDLSICAQNVPIWSQRLHRCLHCVIQQVPVSASDKGVILQLKDKAYNMAQELRELDSVTAGDVELLGVATNVKIEQLINAHSPTMKLKQFETQLQANLSDRAKLWLVLEVKPPRGDWYVPLPSFEPHQMAKLQCLHDSALLNTAYAGPCDDFLEQWTGVAELCKAAKTMLPNDWRIEFTAHIRGVHLQTAWNDSGPVTLHHLNCETLSPITGRWQPGVSVVYGVAAIMVKQRWPCNGRMGKFYVRVDCNSFFGALSCQPIYAMWPSVPPLAPKAQLSDIKNRDANCIS